MQCIAIGDMTFIKCDVYLWQIDTRWRNVISAYLITTFGCWIIFALMWMLIAYAHKDLEFDETGASLHEGEMTCVEGATTFIGFFLLSFELQVTI